jgi:hypothetical protein
MWRLVAIASLATGCTQLFGIDRIPFAGDAGLDAPPDGPPDAAPLLLTVVLTGMGTVTDDLAQLVCSATECHGDYPAGTSVKLTPVGTAPFEFNLWGMVCAGQNVNDDNPVFPDCTVSVGGNVVVTADFEMPDVLNLVADPGSGGDVGAFITASPGSACTSGQTCVMNLLPSAANVMLTPTSNSCSHLVSWRGGNCSNVDLPCVVTFNTNGFGDIITINYSFSVSTGGPTCTQ